MRKAERKTGLAVGIWQLLRRTGGGRSRGPRVLVGAMLAALATVGAAWPAAGEVQEYYELPDDYQPLAVAYLAAPYDGSFKGPSATFRWGATSPATSLIPRFLSLPEPQLWGGIPIGMFKGKTQLTVEESTLRLAVGKPLHITLYAFVPEDRPIQRLKMETRDSDAWNWKRQPAEFSVLSDTSFLLWGAPGDAQFLEIIACVNKRSNTPSVCDDTTSRMSYLAEDPLSGKPTLLMVARGGPPKWLESVDTDICVDGRHKALDLVVPTIFDENAIVRLERPVGQRLCTPDGFKLNYAAVREVGIGIEGLSAKKRHIDSQLTQSANTWKMLAEPPKRGVQQIVLHPPAAAGSSASLLKPPPVPSPKVEQAPPPAPPKKPASAMAAGPPVTVYFDSPNAAAKERLKHGVVRNEDGVFEDVDRQQLRFTLPQESGFAVSKCHAKKATCKFDAQNIELLPKEPVAIPKLVVVTVEFAPIGKRVDLTFQHKGPAQLTIEHVSKGGAAIKLAEREDASLLSKTLQWSPGDKIRVRAVDPEFQKVSQVAVDKRDLPVGDGRSVDIQLAANTKAISIKTEHRLFSGKVTVSSPNGRAVVKFGPSLVDDSIGSVPGAPAKVVPLKDIKPGHELKFEPLDPGKLEVATVVMSDGSQKITLKDATLRFERSHFRNGQLAALSFDIDLRVPSFALPDKFKLQPFVLIGKRELRLMSCKVELIDFLDGKAKFHYKGGYTEVTPLGERDVPKTSSYTVKFQDSAAVCRGLEADGSIAAAKFKGLGPGATLSVLAKRPGSRVFVGIVRLSEKLRADGQNWKAALEALRDAFDSGAKEGGYLWGAIYGPDGNVLVKSETADYTPLALSPILESATKMERLMGGEGVKSIDNLMQLAVNDMRDFEGNVDMLVVSETARGDCGWSSPQHVKGSRAALVRLANFSFKKDSQELTEKKVSGVRRCDSTERSEKAGVTAELEVETQDWVLPKTQLERAIAEAAKSLRNAAAQSAKSSAKH